MIKLLLKFGRVGELLAVALVDAFPDIPEPAPQILLEGVGVGVEALVVVREVAQTEEVLDVGDALADGGAVPLDCAFEFLALAEVDQVDDHVGEVVRQVALAQLAHDVPEHLVRLLRQRAPLELLAVHLLQVHLHRVVQPVQVLHRDRDPVPVEHPEHLLAGEPARPVGVELAEDLLDGGLAHQVLREVEVAVVLPVLVVVARPQPLDEGRLAQLRTGALLLLLFHTIITSGPMGSAASRSDPRFQPQLEGHVGQGVRYGVGRMRGKEGGTQAGGSLWRIRAST